MRNGVDVVGRGRGEDVTVTFVIVERRRGGKKKQTAGLSRYEVRAPPSAPPHQFAAPQPTTFTSFLSFSRSPQAADA